MALLEAVRLNNDIGLRSPTMRNRSMPLTFSIARQVGDIVSIAGIPDATVTDTVAAMTVEAPIPTNPIDPPTIKMTFGVNDSPLAGREGTQLTGGSHDSTTC